MSDINTSMEINLTGKNSVINNTLEDTEKKAKETGEEIKESFKKASKESVKAIKKIEVSMKDVGDNLSSAGTSLTIGLTAPIIASGGIISKIGMDAVETENLFTVSFKNMADQARTWSVETSDALGLNEFELRENSAQLFTMTSSMGLASKEAYNVSTSITTLSSDMASFYNVADEDAFAALRSGLSGESEPLKKFGIIVNENTIKLAALKHGLIKEGEQLSESGKVMARYMAIMDATSDAQGDLARTLDSPTNKLRLLETQVTESVTALGVELLPVTNDVIDVAKDLAEEISEVVETFKLMPPETQKTIVIITGFTAAVGPAMLATGKFITVGSKLTPVIKGLGFVLTKLNPVVAGITLAVGAGVVIYKAMNIELVDFNKLQLKAIENVKAKKEQFITLAEQYTILADKSKKTKEEEEELEKIGKKLIVLNPNLATSAEDLASSYKDSLTPAVREATAAVIQLGKQSLSKEKITLTTEVGDITRDIEKEAMNVANAIADLSKEVDGMEEISFYKAYIEAFNPDEVGRISDQIHARLNQFKDGLAKNYDDIKELGEKKKTAVGITQNYDIKKEEDKLTSRNTLYNKSIKTLEDYYDNLISLQSKKTKIDMIEEFGISSETPVVTSEKTTKTEETTKITKDKTVKEKKVKDPIITNYSKEEIKQLKSIQKEIEKTSKKDLKRVEDQREAWKQYKAKKEELNNEITNNDKLSQDLSFEYEKLIIQQKSELGFISKQDEIMQVADIENQKLEIQKKALEARRAIFEEESLQYQIFSEKIKAITMQQNHTVQVANANVAQVTATEWENASNLITGAVSSNLSNLIGEQRSGAQIMGDIAKDMANQGLSYIINRTLKAIGAYAAEAAAGSAASQASVPIIGPALAITTAAVTFGLVAAYAGSVDSAAGGYYQVPDDMMANIHKNEMVLPAREAEIIRSNISNNESVTGSTTNIAAANNNNISMIPVTDKDILKTLNNNGSAMVKIFKKELRSGRV